MSYPETYRAYKRSVGSFPRIIEMCERDLPKSPASDEVIIRVHAVSLNYRDIAMLEEGAYPGGQVEGGIVASDCAAEVVAVGSNVTLAIGDRVSALFNEEAGVNQSKAIPGLGLGGDIDGVLSEYAVFKEKHLVKLPAHLSWEEVCRNNFSFSQ